MLFEFFEPVANFILETANTITVPAQKNLAALNIRQKEDKSILTDADGKSEAFLTENLTRLIPSSKILGEETAGDWRLSPAWRDDEFVWIIDPIDGTKPYSEGGAYGIMVALRYKGVMQAAWIYYPQTKDMLFASQEDATHMFTWDESGSRTSKSISPPPVVLSEQTLNYYCPKYKGLLGIYAPVAEMFEGASISRCIANETRNLLLTGKNSEVALEVFTPWDHLIPSMIVNCAGGQACCLNDGGENPAGGILAPSPSDMEKILAAIQIVNPRMKIMGGI